MIMQGGMPGSTLPVLVLVVTLVRGAAGSWPVVTWHGAGGTMAECDQMIATIRGLAERCPVPMKTLITFGSPHQGQFGVPDCREATHSPLLCELVRQLISQGAYIPWIQDLVAVAQYWHDPFNATQYSQGSHYLAPINNEVEHRNLEYKAKIENLVNFVMVMFNQDDVVEPKQSAHFEFYSPGQDKEVLPLNESAIYQEDWLGLRRLDESGRLHFFSVEGKHVEIDYDWVAEYIIPFLL